MSDPTVTLSMAEIGFVHALVWKRAADGDAVARSIYSKLKAAAIAGGAVWYYGDPWRQLENCPHCGAQLQEVKTTAPVTCPHCGGAIGGGLEPPQ